MIKSHLKFFILNFSFLILLAACGRKPTEPVPPGPPPEVSNFTLKNLASEFPGEIKTAEYAGKVQLVLFLRTDDAGCRGSLGDWNALQKEFAARGFTLVGAVTDERPVDVVAAEVVALDIPWPIGLADAPVVEAFGGPAAIHAIPTAFLIGRDGFVARRYAGFEPLPTLRADIALALDGQPLPEPEP